MAAWTTRIAAVAAVFFPARPDATVQDEVRAALAFRSPGQRLCCNGRQLALLPCPQPGWALFLAQKEPLPCAA